MQGVVHKECLQRGEWVGSNADRERSKDQALSMGDALEV